MRASLIATRPGDAGLVPDLVRSSADCHLHVEDGTVRCVIESDGVDVVLAPGDRATWAGRSIWVDDGSAPPEGALIMVSSHQSDRDRLAECERAGIRWVLEFSSATPSPVGRRVGLLICEFVPAGTYRAMTASDLHGLT